MASRTRLSVCSNILCCRSFFSRRAMKASNSLYTDDMPSVAWSGSSAAERKARGAGGTRKALAQLAQHAIDRVDIQTARIGAHAPFAVADDLARPVDVLERRLDGALARPDDALCPGRFNLLLECGLVHAQEQEG